MIYIASDHAGFKLKEKLKKFLENKNILFKDLGPEKFNKEDDYPEYAIKVARKVQKNKNKGILICGTGQGMCISSNKVKNIIAALCWNIKTAKHAKEHLNANIICIPGFLDETFCKKIVNVWINLKFKKGKYSRRIKKINNIR